MKKIVLILFAFLFLSLQKTEGQEIELTGYREHIKNKTFNSIGLNYYITDMFKIGVSFQNLKNIKYDYYIFNVASSYTDDFYGTANLQSYEINFSFIPNFKITNKIIAGIGLKPAVHYNSGTSIITSHSVSFIDIYENGIFRDTISVNKLNISKSVIAMIKYKNILNSNFSISFEIEGGIFFWEYFKSKHINTYDFYEIFKPYSRISFGISYRFKKKNTFDDKIF